MAEDRPNNIVKVVCDAAGQSTNRLHATGLLEICLQTCAFLFETLPSHRIGDSVESHAQ